jgi:hypothetical protein
MAPSHLPETPFMDTLLMFPDSLTLDQGITGESSLSLFLSFPFTMLHPDNSLPV